MCTAFCAWAKPQGWTPYAETAGWDVLLVAPDGTQIGVQAKLKFNLHVLSQAVEDRHYWGETQGPDFRAVLVPEDPGYSNLCAALGLTVFTQMHIRNGWEFRPGLPGMRYVGMAEWHFCNHEKRYVLPKYVPDVVAGASAPVQLTRWKVGALQVCAAIEVRGYVTRDDFRRYGIDHRRWINDNAWLIQGDAPGKFIRGPSLGFDKQHPTVYQQVLAEVREELTKLTLI